MLKCFICEPSVGMSIPETIILCLKYFHKGSRKYNHFFSILCLVIHRDYFQRFKSRNEMKIFSCLLNFRVLSLWKKEFWFGLPLILSSYAMLFQIFGSISTFKKKSKHSWLILRFLCQYQNFLSVYEYRLKLKDFLKCHPKIS